MANFSDSSDWIPVTEIEGLYFSVRYGFYFAISDQIIKNAGIHNHLLQYKIDSNQMPNLEVLKKESNDCAENFDIKSDEVQKIKTRMVTDFEKLFQKESLKAEPTPKIESDSNTDSKTAIVQKATKKETTPKSHNNKKENKEKKSAEISKLEAQLERYQALEEKNNTSNMNLESISRTVTANMHEQIATSATKLAANVELQVIHLHLRNLFPPEWDYADWIEHMVMYSLKKWHITLSVGLDNAGLDSGQRQLIYDATQDWLKRIKEDKFEHTENPSTPEVETLAPA